MWIFPTIGMVLMFFCVILFFSRRRFGSPNDSPFCFWNRSYDNKTDENNNSLTAFEILKKRYASGEITKEQYEQIKKDIS